MKVKIIASLAVVGSLLLSGCAHRAPVKSAVTPLQAAKPTIKDVQNCHFVINIDGGETYKGKDVILITYTDGKEWIRFPNGSNHLVGNTNTIPNSNGDVMHLIADTTTDNKVLVGGAYGCR